MMVLAFAVLLYVVQPKLAGWSATLQIQVVDVLRVGMEMEVTRDPVKCAREENIPKTRSKLNVIYVLEVTSQSIEDKIAVKLVPQVGLMETKRLPARNTTSVMCVRWQ